MMKSMSPNLMVESVEETISFYEEKLGFIMVASVPSEQGGLQFGILVKDDLTLMVQEKNNFISEYPALETDKVKPSISLYIQTDDLDSLYDNLKAVHTINTEMHTTFYGTKEFAILDNSGYVLTFTEEKK
ncbi:VOC family protein [Enterococcus alishanensis]|uniref:VOC family protein n=1 Tax=Enterococcus alishanensis TaxID=1303817 RepID=A0ABS6TCV4_9ENTE|nr:VOC family protein [Enterococcus alishanensis]MBV7390684.1 VOC family protein [Enterococcus alishanensis]